MNALSHKPEQYIPLLYRALEEEIGILIEVTKPLYLRQGLYTARQMAADPKLDELMFFIPQSNDRVLIAKRSVELDP